MSGKQKALLILLAFALVVLFVIAVGVNTGKEKGNAGESNGFVDWLAKLGARNSTVDPATVSASCPAVDGRPNTYKITGKCTFTVADPGGIKSVVFESGATFGVEAPGPGDSDFTMSDDVEPSPAPSGPVARAKVAVDKRTQIVVSCPGLPNAQCIVTIVPE